MWSECCFTMGYSPETRGWVPNGSILTIISLIVIILLGQCDLTQGIRLQEKGKFHVIPPNSECSFVFLCEPILLGFKWLYLGHSFRPRPAVAKIMPSMNNTNQSVSVILSYSGIGLVGLPLPIAPQSWRSPSSWPSCFWSSKDFLIISWRLGVYELLGIVGIEEVPLVQGLGTFLKIASGAGNAAVRSLTHSLTHSFSGLLVLLVVSCVAKDRPATIWLENTIAHKASKQ